MGQLPGESLHCEAPGTQSRLPSAVGPHTNENLQTDSGQSTGGVCEGWGGLVEDSSPGAPSSTLTLILFSLVVPSVD